MSTKPSGTPERDPNLRNDRGPESLCGLSERDGKTYHFCSTACKDRFDSTGQPEAHLCCRRAV